MAQVVGGQVKLDNGKLITPQQGAWYDGQQFWAGSLSAPGQINPASNQQGAGQYVSPEVIRQTNPANVGYIQQQQQKYGAPAASTPTGVQAPTSGVPGQAFTSPEVPNFPDIYKGLYESSGIKGLQDQLVNTEKQYLEARGKISDNPFLSASMVDKRLARLEAKYQTETKPLSDKIAMQKADVETQLNLKIKQFDIESQAAQQALQRLSFFLESGALENASGEDIANITRSTGVSSSMIQSAINAQRQKNVQTQVISYDDGTNQGFAVINQRTGEIINKQNVAPSKPKAAKELSSSDIQQTYVSSLRSDVASGLGVKDIFYIWSGLLDPNTIISIYNATSPYGPARESKKELEKYGVK